MWSRITVVTKNRYSGSVIVIAQNFAGVTLKRSSALNAVALCGVRMKKTYSDGTAGRLTTNTLLNDMVYSSQTTRGDIPWLDKLLPT